MEPGGTVTLCCVHFERFSIAYLHSELHTVKYLNTGLNIEFPGNRPKFLHCQLEL